MDTTPIAQPSLPLNLPKTDGAEVTKARDGFSKMLSNTVDQVTQAEKSADKAIENLHTGKAKNLHEVMIAVEEADISLRMFVQMRNKALDAYSEIMRLQI